MKMKAAIALFCVACASVISAHIVASPVYAVRRSIDSKPRAMRAREEQLRRRLERNSRSQKTLDGASLSLEDYHRGNRRLDLCEVSDCDLSRNLERGEILKSQDDDYDDYDEVFGKDHGAESSPWTIDEFLQSPITEISIGTPPQKIRVIISISSSDLFIPSSHCRSVDCKGRFLYNSTLSTSYKANNTQVFTEYFHVHAASIISEDTANIAGINVEHQLFHEGQYVTYHDRLPPDKQGWDGYLGLAPSNNGSIAGIGNVFQNMVSSGLLDQNIFSLKLSRGPEDPGETMFGGINRDLYTGELKTMPLVSDRVNLRFLDGCWKVPFEGLGIYDWSVSPKDWIAVLDSDIPFIGLSEDWMTLIHDYLGMQTRDPVEPPSMSCDTRDEMDDLVFLLGGHEFAFSAYEYTFEVYLESWKEVRCASPIATTTSFSENEYVILGSFFLRKFYGVFDAEARTVSLAEAKSLKGRGR